MKPTVKFWLGILFIFYLVILISNIGIGIGIIYVLIVIYAMISLVSFEYSDPEDIKYHIFNRYNLIYLIHRFNKYLNKKFEKKQ